MLSNKDEQLAASVEKVAFAALIRAAAAGGRALAKGTKTFRKGVSTGVQSRMGMAGSKVGRQKLNRATNTLNNIVKYRRTRTGRNAKSIPGKAGYLTGRALGTYGNALKSRGVQMAAAGAGGWGAKTLYDRHNVKSRLGAAVRAFKGGPKTPKKARLIPNPSWKSGKGLDNTRLKNMMNQLNRPGITL